MPLKVTSAASGKMIESGEKRFYLPGASIETECPKCQVPFKEDFAKDYFSYPPFNVPFNYGLYCGACGHEWNVSLQINVSLTAP